MIRTLMCTVFSAFTIAAAAAERSLSFEAETLNGCSLENGIIRLHRELPAQENGEKVVLSAAKPIRIFFQEDVFARKSGAKPDELIQIKKSAEEYTPQFDDPDAKTGYIDYAKQASYQYMIQTPGEYTVWFRVWTPSVANWRFFVSDDQGFRHEIVLKDSIPAAKQWFWKKGFTARLDAGSHQLQILQAMNGKRISAILLTLDPSFVPEGDIPASARRKITKGSVQFKTAAPPALIRWKGLTAQTKGSASFQVSTDGGKNFFTLEGNDLSRFGKEPLTLKLNLSRDDSSAEPEARDIQASYLYDEQQFCPIEADGARYIFSRTDGALSGIVNTATGTVIQPTGINGSMFRLLLKTIGKNDRRHLSMKDAQLLSLDRISPEKLKIIWNFPNEKIEVSFTVTAEGNRLVWQIKVDNRHSETDVIEVEGPILSELRISRDPASDTLVWPFSAGEFIPFPAEKGEISVAYPDHAGLPFAILTNGRESFYYGCHDEKLLTTDFTSAANTSSNAISLSICRRHRIPAGTSRTDTFVTAVLNGTWHKGADLYREYFYSVYPKNAYRPWLRNCDAWLQGSACGHTGLMKQYKDYTAFQYSFREAAFLSLDYIQMWGSTFNGACPSYYLPRLDKGGETMFAEQMKFWRDHGGHTGHYFFGNGIAPYYLLTDRYFGTPWENYPAEYRPPSFDWYVKNREYISESAGVNEAELRKKTSEINEVHSRKQIVAGNYEESTGYMSMNWRNGEFAKFLGKWIGIYVSRYHCDTAYLDTFAFRNAQPDFNPHLQCNGEGDKVQFKLRFLKTLFADMRKQEPDFCALTEGIADVFGTHLYFLLSGFARNPNIFRYTLPDQIIFQGSSNGLWSKPLTKKSILQSFLCGNRFDLVRIYPETYYMLKLRQQIAPFLNLAVFDDVKGIAVSDPEITVYAHRILPETETVIPAGGTRAVTLTIGNQNRKSGTVTYELPAGFRLDRAMICELYRDPRPLDFQRDGNRITFQAPAGSASAAVLIDTLKGAHRFTVTAEQISRDRVAVRILNFTKDETVFSLDIGDQQKQLKVPGSDSGTAEFSFSVPDGQYRILPVTVTAPGMDPVRRIISVGETNQKIPMPELSAQSAGKNLTLDFEETVYSTRAAASGKRGFLLEGNGKFRMHSFALDLVPNAHYELTMRLRKSENVSPKAGDCFAMIAFYTKEDKKLVRLVQLGGNVANDGKFHSLKAEFDTPGNLNRPRLHFYNLHSEGELSVDDVCIVEISRAAAPPEQAKAAAPSGSGLPKEGKQAEKRIPVDWGETELDESVPLQDKHVIKLTGNGGYLHRRIPLTLEAGKTYRLSFMIRKGFDVGKVGYENMVGVFNYTKEKKLETYLRLAGSVRGDDSFHFCQGTFTVPETVHNCALYIYNRNSKDTVTVGELSLVELQGPAASK